MARGSTDWEKTKNEKYAEKWFTDNGFSFALVRQYLSKTIYTVEKDGVTDEFSLPSDVTKIALFMQQYAKSFQLKVEYLELREQVKKEGLI